MALENLSNHLNFSGGPGALPEPVLKLTQAAIMNVPEVGLSVLGISHRSDWFRDVVDETENNLRELLGVPRDYHVLFLQGGSSLQFSMIPMNLLHGSKKTAEYIVSGYWSAKAVPEASIEGKVRVVWDGRDSGYNRLPAAEKLVLSSEAAYLHYVSNETVEGVQFSYLPGMSDDVPLICDMASDFLSQPIAVDRYALVYAHAQKNLGPAGLTVVILRDDLLQRIPSNLHKMLDYRTHIKSKSIYNTPPVFALYVVMQVSRWLRKDIGGLAAMAEINQAKAATLYKVLDESGGFYQGHAIREYRSLMNVTFRLADPNLEPLFLKTAVENGFYGLDGHRSIGGLRASLYNAVTQSGVEDLAAFMVDFQQCYG
ncbi:MULTISPECIES: phosphoserine transaminase [unclassified Nostoc]|uniref:phosphoserine transaminase n=1 Tax=unclassified Nostoc TaxID=2593658 RepID=UPI001D393C30|nr:phosphoserine transaminase [Nostoc sp. JL23]MBN3878067.1 phosphoserine transaminase [Nostoc sp. JL23]